jgi:hypothetical protein
MHRSLLSCAVLFSSLSWAISGGPDPGLAGAPGEADCSACHGPGSGTYATQGKLTISVVSGGAAYTPGSTVRLRVTLEDPNALRWGFQITARKTSATESASGTLVAASSTTFVQNFGGVQFLNHGPSGNFPNTSNSASWELDWTAPAAGSGSVSFFAAGNAANRNGSADAGDRVYKASLELPEATGTPATPTAKTHSIPQFAFGGGFASTLYFTNSTDAEVTFDAAFFRNNGSALEVGGAAIQSVKIPARGLAVINAPNEGALTQGWAGFNLPDGVTGFNRLRQITENQADRELIIPITKTNEQQKTLVVFDDTVINTQLVVANPGSAEATITATVRDDQGATIGTSEFKLAAGAKVVVLLKDRVADAAGKRGTIELTTSTSAVSALAIRFDGTALVATEALIVDEEVPEE